MDNSINGYNFQGVHQMALHLQTGKWSENVIRRVVRSDWLVKGGRVEREVLMMDTPRVVEVRKHFNCPELEGAELEDQGVDGTAMTHCEKRVSEDMDERRSLLLLPEEIILQIFQNLPIKDHLAAKSTCTYLYNLGKDREAWRGKVWTLTKNNCKDNIYEEQLKKIPQIQAIDIRCMCPKAVVDKIILNVGDLQKLTATVETIPRIYIIKLIQNYKNLQSFSTCVKFEDALFVLDALKSCRELKQLNFVPFFNGFYIGDAEYNAVKNYNIPEADCKDLVKLLLDSFPKLTSINLRYFQLFLKNEDVAVILENKKEKLKNLELCWYRSDDNNLIDIVSNSEKINVYLSILCKDSIPLHLEKLKDIKNLKIYIFWDSETNLFELTNCGSLSLSNVKYLKVDGMVKDFDLVKFVVETFPDLENFYNSCHILKVRAHEISFNSLLDLQRLSKLETLTVCLFDQCELSISHISQCSTLKSLTIYFYVADYDDISSIKKLKNLAYLKFFILFCEEDKLLSLISSLENLRELVLVNVSANRVYHYENKDDVPLISAYCEEKNIHLKIDFKEWGK